MFLAWFLFCVPTCFLLPGLENNHSMNDFYIFYIKVLVWASLIFENRHSLKTYQSLRPKTSSTEQTPKTRKSETPSALSMASYEKKLLQGVATAQGEHKIQRRDSAKMHCLSRFQNIILQGEPFDKLRMVSEVEPLCIFSWILCVAERSLGGAKPEQFFQRTATNT